MATVPLNNPSNLRYTYYYDEGEGYYHVRYLGCGMQGTASLVRSAQTGELLVRKRAFPLAILSNTAEADYAMLLDQQSNIVKCLGLYQYEVGAQKHITNVTYWRYASHLDLRNLVLTFRAHRYRVPEIVIWRYLKEVSAALNYMHRQGLLHSDAHESNTFVDWSSHDTLPTFILGDLGLARPFDGGGPPPSNIDTSEMEMPSLANIHLTYPYNAYRSVARQPCLRNVHNDLRFIIGCLDILMSDSEYERSGTLYFGYERPQQDQAGDASVTQCMSLCKTRAGLSVALPQPEDEPYSEALREVRMLFRQLPDYVLTENILTYDTYQHLYGQVYQHICAEEARCLAQGLSQETLDALKVAREDQGRNHGTGLDTDKLKPCICAVAERDSCAAAAAGANKPLLDHLPSIDTVLNLSIDDRQEQDGWLKSHPRLFRSPAELLDYNFRPPGPWHIVEVDGLTEQPLQKQNLARDLEYTKCTDGQRRKIDGEPWNQ